MDLKAYQKPSQAQEPFFPYSHDMLVSMLDRFGNDERQLLQGNHSSVGWLAHSLLQAFHEGNCHMTIFGDRIHWHVILLDGRDRVDGPGCCACLPKDHCPSQGAQGK